MAGPPHSPVEVHRRRLPLESPDSEPDRERRIQGGQDQHRLHERAKAHDLPIRGQRPPVTRVAAVTGRPTWAPRQILARLEAPATRPPHSSHVTISNTEMGSRLSCCDL